MSGRSSPRRTALPTDSWNPDDVVVDRRLDDLPDRVLYSEDDTEPPEPQRDPPPAAPDHARTDRRTSALEPSEEPSDADIAAEASRAVERAAHHLQRLGRKRQRHGHAEWMHRDLSTLPVCVIDLETTGGRHDSDEILEVGAVLLRGDEPVREFSSLVDPERPITAAAHRVHRIGNADVAGAPRVNELLPWVRELAEHRVLLFHNAGFDLGFLQRAFAEAGQEPLRQPVIDTVVVARRLMGAPCGLGRLGQRLGIDLPHAHRALADARLTARVWLWLRGRLEQAGATTLGEVPGVIGRASGRARRMRSRSRALLHLLREAIGEAGPLEVAYRAAPGIEPVVLQVRPLRILHNRVCRVLDLETGATGDLQLDRVDSCRRHREHRQDACVDPDHGV